jgi:hypothetical protein
MYLAYGWTHSTAPQQFGQLFCIIFPLSDSHVSVVYAIIPRKQTITLSGMFHSFYRRLFTEGHLTQYETIVADYEIVMHNAESSVIGSSIHYTDMFAYKTYQRHPNNTSRECFISKLQQYLCL